MMDTRLTRLAGPLLLTLAVVACGEEIETKPGDTIIEEAVSGPSVVAFEAAPGEIEAGGAAVLRWTTRDVVSLEIKDSAGVAVPVGDDQLVQGEVSVQPDVTTTYTLTATGAEGTPGPAWRSVTVTVHPSDLPRPTIEEFDAAPALVAIGDGVVLSWRTADATELTLKDDAGVEVDVSALPATEGQITVEPTRAPTTYVLTATGPGGRTSREAIVDVSGAPRVSRFFVEPLAPVTVGSPVTLVWETVNATRVVVKQDSTTLVDTTTQLSGSREIVLDETATFTIDATGSGGTAHATAIGQVGARVLSFSASEHVVREGDVVTFSWAIEDADRAVLEGPGDWQHTIPAAELASGTVTHPIDFAGDFVLQAFRGDVPRTARLSVSITEAPRVRALSVDSTIVTAAGDFPATVTLSWRQDGAERCTILANNIPVPDYDNFECGTTGTAPVTLTGTATLKLLATNSAGQHGLTVGVEAVPPARIEAFAKDPARRLSPGDQVTLSWEVEDAVSIALTKNGANFPIGSALTGTATDTVLADSVYVLAAKNSLGHETTASLTVEAGVPVILSAAADPDFLAIGESFTLSWTANGGDELQVKNQAGENLFETTDPAVIDDGSTRLLAPTVAGTYTYTVVSTNGAGSATATVVIRVSDGPMIRSFTGTPLQLTLGQSLVFAWTVSNDAYGNTPVLALTDNYAHVYNEIASKNPNNGTVTITPTEEGQHVFTLTASTGGGRMDAVRTVTVEVTVPPILSTFTATPDRVTTNGGQVVPTVELAWASQNGVLLELFEAEPDGTVHPPAFHRVTTQAAIDAGTLTVRPTVSTWYVARLHNRIGTVVNRQLKVIVDPPEVLTFTATPNEISEGGTVQLAWTTRNATSVTVDPAVQFVDIANKPWATKSGLVGDSGVATIPFPAGFTFPFEGTPRTAIQASTNGTLGFNTTNTSSGGYTPTLPNSYGGYMNFSLYGCDLDGNQNSPAGEVWYGLTSDAYGDMFVVQYKNWSWWSSSYRPSSLNMELVLRPNGNFEFRYGTMTAQTAERAAGQGCMVGYQGTTTTRPWELFVPYQQALAGGLANKSFLRPALPALPVNGTLPVNPSQTTTYTLKAINADADTTATTTVTVWKTPLIRAAAVSPLVPLATRPFDISWQANFATRIRVLDGAGAEVCAVTDPAKLAAGSCTTTEPTEGLKVYTVVAENGPVGAPVATTTRTVSFTVFPYLAITSFTISPTNFPELGDTVTLNWTSVGAVEVYLYACPPGTLEPTMCPDITPAGAVPGAGTYQHTMTTSVEFWLIVYDTQYRPASQMQGAWIDPASLDTFTATATQILAGGSTTLQWTSTDATSVAMVPPLGWQEVTSTAPFIDLTSTGTTVAMDSSSSNDSGRYPINFPAGFSFPWFGSNKTGLIATTDGWITFDMGYNSYDYSNASLPDPTNPALAIAPFWDDGEVLGGSRVIYELKQPVGGMKHLVVQWKEYHLYYNSTVNFNFEVVLWENGEIDFRYGTMNGGGTYDADARGAGAVIGFQSPDLTVGKMISANAQVSGGLQNRSWRYRMKLGSNGSLAVSPTQSTTYRLCATNASGYQSCKDLRILVIGAGDLLFSEAMIAPASADAEWFEIRNMSPDPIDLAHPGWSFSSLSELYPIPGGTPLVIPAGGYQVFARSGNAAVNGGLSSPHVYGTALGLNDTTDSLAIYFGGLAVDQISWDATWPIQAGKSIAVEPTLMSRSPGVNDPATAWCATQATYGNNTLGGSPGVAGPGCLAPPAP